MLILVVIVLGDTLYCLTKISKFELLVHLPSVCIRTELKSYQLYVQLKNRTDFKETYRVIVGDIVPHLLSTVIESDGLWLFKSHVMLPLVFLSLHVFPEAISNWGVCGVP